MLFVRDECSGRLAYSWAIKLQMRSGLRQRCFTRSSQDENRSLPQKSLTERLRRDCICLFARACRSTLRSIASPTRDQTQATIACCMKLEKGQRRLYRHTDEAHPYRSGGKTAPARSDIPEEYWYLIDWYEKTYDR